MLKFEFCLPTLGKAVRLARNGFTKSNTTASASVWSATVTLGLGFGASLPALLGGRLLLFDGNGGLLQPCHCASGAFERDRKRIRQCRL